MIVGHNIYVNSVKMNESLIPVGSPVTNYVLSGLASNTDFSVTATNVDQAGNESDPSAVKVLSTLRYTPPPEDPPMGAADKAAIDAIVAESMAVTKQPGVAVTVSGPKGFYAKAYGYSNRAAKTPLSLDDHFRMASMTKTFTAAAVLLQVQNGNLLLTDPLDDYVPGIPNGDVITIEHLLLHRSGVGEYLGAFSIALRMLLFPTSAVSEDGVIDIIRSAGSQFTPGTQFKYTNSNYILLGAVVKAVTGRDIATVIAEDICVPLGLVETSWPETADMPTPYAHGYKKNTTLPGRFHPSLAGASGALVTTMGDLVKWAKVLRDGTLFTNSMHLQWLETFSPVAGNTGYGYGNVRQGTWIGHNGGIPGGYSGIVMFEQGSGTVIAILENYQQGDNQAIFERIAERLYPGTASAPLFGRRRLLPVGSVMSLTGGAPRVAIDTPNRVLTPTSVSLVLVPGIPGRQAITPDPVVMSLTTGTPVVTVSEFTPFTEENVARIDRPIPAGASGCWVTLAGAGGGGGTGYRGSTNVAKFGGGGGGGGAVVPRFFIPRTDLGDTYSVTIGTGGVGAATAANSSTGNAGSDGGATIFTSGALTVTAAGGVGGGGGEGGNTGAVGGAGGAGGVVSASGFAEAPTGFDGTAGADGYAKTVTERPDNTDGGAAGGAGGAGCNSFWYIGSASPGGNSLAGDGGAAGVSGSPEGKPADDQAPGEPGGGGGGGRGSANSYAQTASAGGRGGRSGGGGGGGSAGSNTATTAPGGDGGNGSTVIEWV